MRFDLISGSRWGRCRRRRAVSDVVATLIMVAVVVSLGVVAFTFASTGLGTMTQSFTGLMSNQGNAVAEHYAVEQVSYSSGGMVVEGATTAKFSSASSGFFTLSTSSSNDVIVVLVSNENQPGAVVRTVSTITATGLVFSAHSSGAGNQISTAPYVDAEVWSAIAASPLSSVLITVTLSGSTEAASIVAFGVSGANTGTPWDPHPALAVAKNTASSLPTASVTTNNANDMILGFTGIGAAAGSSTLESNTAGFTMIQQQLTAAGGDSSLAAAEYQLVSSVQSPISVAFTAVNTNWVMIGDALQAAASSTLGADVYVRNVGPTSSTLVSVYVADQTTGLFVNQFAVNTALNAGTVFQLPHNAIAFTWVHGHTYSFTITSNLGNSVIYNARAA
jgi:flagellin-like protein